MTAFVIALLAQVPASGVQMAPATPKMAAPASQSLAKVKRLCLATLMYTQDHRDVLPSAANFRAAVMPYLKDPDGFTAPGAPKGSVGYFFEPRLSRMSLMKPAFPAETAMIVEGSRGKATLPYEGRTVIGYVDGHARLVNAKAVQKARAISLK